jgi:hypothetical protein
MKAVTGIPIGPSLDVAKLLLASGADVNARDNDGQTVLMKAANNATVYDEVVKLLLSRGAEVNARNENGLTALAIAARVGRADVVRLLLANGANVITQESSEYQTALTNTVQKGASVTFKIMTAAGQDYQVSLERTVQYKGETFASNGDDQPIRFGILFVVGEDGFPKNAVVVKYIGSELHRTALEKGLIESLQKQKADGPAGAIRSWDGTIEENPSPAQRQ